MPESDSTNLESQIDLMLGQDDWWRVEGTVAKLGPAAVPILIRKVDDEELDPVFIERAILGLGAIGGSEAEQFILTLLKREPAEIRVTALIALRKIGNAKHAPAVRPLLNDSNDSVRREAIKTLAAFGDAPIISALVAITQSTESESLKQLAQQAIEEIEKRNA